MTLIKQDGPHLRAKSSTFGKMMELTVALLVLYIAAVAFNFIKHDDVQYGIHAIVIGVLSVGIAVVCDALYFIPYLAKRKKIANNDSKWAEPGVKSYFYMIGHSYSYVSGLILALLLPVGTAYYTVIVSAVIGVMVGKLIFGGFGYNIVNPAILGRVFAQLCFSGTLKTYIGSEAPISVATGASITSTMQGSGWLTTEYGVSLTDTLLGNYSGTLGETFAFLIIAIGIYLAVRKIIDWRISVTYVLSIFTGALLIGLCGGLKGASFEWAIRQVMIGGVLFGAVFCLTDPVTSPTAPMGKILFALIAALVTVGIRYQAAAPEGVAYSILIANICAPVIDLVFKGKSNDKMLMKVGACGFVFLCIIGFGVGFGCLNKVEAPKVGVVNQTLTVEYHQNVLPENLMIDGGNF